MSSASAVYSKDILLLLDVGKDVERVINRIVVADAMVLLTVLVVGESMPWNALI